MWNSTVFCFILFCFCFFLFPGKSCKVIWIAAILCVHRAVFLIPVSLGYPSTYFLVTLYDIVSSTERETFLLREKLFFICFYILSAWHWSVVFKHIFTELIMKWMREWMNEWTPITLWDNSVSWEYFGLFCVDRPIVMTDWYSDRRTANYWTWILFYYVTFLYKEGIN